MRQFIFSLEVNVYLRGKHVEVGRDPTGSESAETSAVLESADLVGQFQYRISG